MKSKEKEKTQNSSVEVTVKNQQLNLGLKQPLTNDIVAVKEKIRKNLQYFEIRRYIRSSEAWILTLLAISLIAVQSFYIYNLINRLPNIIPIYLNAIDLSDRLGYRLELLVFPILSSVIVLVTTVTGYQLYNSHKELITFSLINMIVCVSVLTFVLLKLFAVYL